MRLANIIAGTIGIIISVVFYISAEQLPGFALKMAGPEFFPKLIAVLQGLIAIWLIKLNIIRWREPSPEADVDVADSSKVIFVIIMTGIYYFVLDVVGFWLATFVYAFILSLLTQSKRRWIPAGLTSLSIICVIYLVFSLLLKASLPTGMLF